MYIFTRETFTTVRGMQKNVPITGIAFSFVGGTLCRSRIRNTFFLATSNLGNISPVCDGRVHRFFVRPNYNEFLC